MSNKAIKQPKPKKRRKKPQQSRQKKSHLRLAVGAGSTIITLIGFAVAVLTLLPRISVTPTDPVDPNNTLSASFTIANNNFIPLRHVTAELSIGEIQPVGKPLDPDVAYANQGGLLPLAWTNHSLDMDDHFTITPNDVIHASGDREASISIIVRYQPWILPIEREKRFRFETHRQSDGKLYWYSLPAN